MARNNQSASKARGASPKAKSPSAKNAQQKRGAARPVSDPAATSHFIDERTRRDIWGVVFAVLAVALFVTAIMPADAVVTSTLGYWLHLLFGIGAYLLPFVLLLIGCSFVLRFERQQVPARVAVGLAMLFVAVLGLFGLFTPAVTSSTLSRLFLETNLVAQGGYLGAGLAWVGLSFLGQAVSVIILIGVIIIALLIIGFSISALIEKVRNIRTPVDTELPIDDTAPIKRPKKTKREQDMSLSERFGKIPASTGGKTTSFRQRNTENSHNLSAQETRAFEAGESEDLSNQKTRSFSRKASDSRSAGPTRATRSLNDSDAQATAAFDAPDSAPASPQSMTRKLGTKKRSSSAAPVVTEALPKATDGFALPSMSLLKKEGKRRSSKAMQASLRETALLLQDTLADFGVEVEVVAWIAGPTVTLFEVDLPPGVRVNKVSNLADDIALALAAPGVRIFAPVPNTNYVGIEVPNKQRESVLLGDVLPSAKMGPLQVAIGRDVEGHNVVSNLAAMPHILIGGTTGSGKSVCINSMIMSILMRATPAEVRLILIDPKRVEFMPYNGIPHLYVPVVTECKEAASALAWAVAEMERRLKVLSKAGCRKIDEYNAKVQKGLTDENGNTVDQMPFIVIVIDELADLMMNVGKDVEFSISRLAQLARAAGIHLIVATQRPSANVVTGLIKANITNRIAFNVASGIDSRVILDSPGAENLIGLGDMLLSKPSLPKPQRLQGCYVDESEINAVVELLKEQGEPEYHQEILKTNLISKGDVVTGSNGSSSNDDPLLWEAAEAVVSSGMGSTSGIQRRLKVGYARAGRIMDMLEEKGVVGPSVGSKPREVLVDALELETLKAFEQNDVD